LICDPRTADDDYKYAAAADIFSLGVNFWELATRREPHAGKTPVQIISVVAVKGTPLLITDDDNIPTPFVDLIRKCCSKDSTSRPHTLDVCKSFALIKLELAMAVETSRNASLTPASSSVLLETMPIPASVSAIDPSGALSERVPIPLPLTPSDDSVLLRAARVGKWDLVRSLLKNTASAEINQPNKQGETLLMMASSAGNVSEVEWLLVNGAAPSVNAKNTDGGTAVLLAARQGTWEVVHMLVKKGASANDRDRHDDTMLLMLARQQNWDDVGRLAAAYPALVNVQAADGETLLMKAARSEQYPLVQLLIEKCAASVTSTNKDGDTVLLVLARSQRWAAIAELALSCRACVNVESKDGDSVAMKAAAHHQWDVVKLLVQTCGAALSATFATCAASDNKWDVVKWLVETWYDRCMERIPSFDALQKFAADHRNWEMVAWLSRTTPAAVRTMQIFVTTPAHTTLTLEVDSSDTIETVKQYIYSKDGMPTDQRDLFFEGKLLNDDRTLNECGIEHKSDLQLMSRLHGGSGTNFCQDLDRPDLHLGCQLVGYHRARQAKDVRPRGLARSGDSDLRWQAN